MDPFAVGIFGMGAALFALLTVVGLVSFMRTFGRHPRRKVSLVSPLLLIIGLGCIAALHGTTSIDPRVAGILALFVVIPIGVIVASTFAASFLEPVVMAVALFLIPLLGGFMPMMSGTQNPLHPPPGAEFGPVFNLLGYTTVLLVPLSAIGFGVLYVSRKIRARQWTWSVLRGLAWGVPCSAGGVFGLKSKLSSDIAFQSDYTMVWVIVGIFAVITGLAGLKRNPEAGQRPSQSETPMDGKAPQA